MRDFIAISKALADPTRVRLLMALESRELCVCQLIELVQLAPSTVSKHMSILRQADLVRYRKDGRWMHYSQPGDDATREVRDAIGWVRRALADDRQIAADRRALDGIVQTELEVLCRRQAPISRSSISAPETPAAAKWPKDGRGT